jgi:hypothetical protein
LSPYGTFAELEARLLDVQFDSLPVLGGLVVFPGLVGREDVHVVETPRPPVPSEGSEDEGEERALLDVSREVSGVPGGSRVLHALVDRRQGARIQLLDVMAPILEDLLRGPIACIRDCRTPEHDLHRLLNADAAESEDCVAVDLHVAHVPDRLNRGAHQVAHGGRFLNQGEPLTPGEGRVQS